MRKHNNKFDRADLVNAGFAWAIILCLGFGYYQSGYYSPDVPTLFTSIMDSRAKIPVLVSVFAIPLAVLVIELMDRGWENSALRKILFVRSASARIDFLSWIVLSYLRLGWLFMYLTTFAAFAQGNIAIQALFDVRLLDYIDNPYLQFAASFIIMDFFYYWTHRLEHKVDFLWCGHSVHHSADQLVVLSAFRQSPLTEQFSHLFSALPLALLGTPVETFVIIGSIAHVQSMLTHSSLQYNFGWIGRWLIVSPIHHQIHHSAAFKHRDRNFGTHFIVWDHFFGTYYEPGDETKQPGFRFGVDEENRNKSFLREQLNAALKTVVSFVAYALLGVHMVVSATVRFLTRKI